MEKMKPLNEIYGKRFFAKRYKLHWRAPHVCKAIHDVLVPDSVVDVGCATGDLVQEWRQEFDIDSLGIEGDPSCLEFAVSDRILIHDLRVPIFKTSPYDLCTCFEVAEHIEPEYASVFVENLIGLSDQILVSIAPPGQGGHYHVNCQPIEYWITLFWDRGYILDGSTTLIIKKGLEPWRKKDGIKASYMNLAFFRRKCNER